MKYKPKPVETSSEMNWDVQFEEDGGYIFENQDDAMIFCLLLEIRDLLGENDEY